MNKIYFLILLLVVLSCGKAENGQNLTIEPMVATLPNEMSGTVELVVNSDGDWTLEHYSTAPSWFEMTPLRGTAGTSKVTVKVLEVNSDTLERVSFINFKTKAITKTVTIQQAPPIVEEPEETPESDKE